MEILQSYDVVILTETSISKNTCYNFDIKGYSSYHLFGNKSQNITKGCYSGGISVYFKSSLENYVKIVQSTQCGIVWLKISKLILNNDSDIYVCCTYIPPTNSRILRQADQDMLDLIESDIEKYKILGKIILTGDLNSRMSNERDYIIHDQYLDSIDDPENAIYDTARVNSDHVIDARGQRLLDFCKSTNLLICDGRLYDDKNKGNFTFISKNASTVIDYVLANQTDFKLFNSFEILPPNEFSDHCAIYFSLWCTRPSLSHDQTGNYSEPILAWETTCTMPFRNDLNKQLPLLGNLTMSLQNDSTTVDDSVRSFTSMLWDTAFKYFGKFRNIKKTTQTKVQKNSWFNAECLLTRKEFNKARNLYIRNKNEENRISLIDKKHIYIQTIRRNKSKFKASEGKRISNLAKTNLKSFWKHIKSTFKNKTMNPTNIKIDELFQHFKSLYEIQKDADIQENENTQQSDTEIVFDDELDQPFTDSEIKSAVFSQNN